MSVNFGAILENTKLDDIEKPKPLPAGSYIAAVGAHKLGESSKKGTPYIEYEFKIESALDDVDPDELEDFGDITKKTLRGQFYLTESALFMLKDFLTVHVEDVEMPEGAALDEVIGLVEGYTVGVRVKGDTNEQDEPVSYFDRTFCPSEA